MIPVRQFVKEIPGIHDLAQHLLFDILRQAGYYEFHSGFDWQDIKHNKLLYDDKCRGWCERNYPNDTIYDVSGTFFFTNKEIATLMKLSVL